MTDLPRWNGDITKQKAASPEVRVVDPITSQAWQSLVSTIPASVFHSPAWLRVLAATYGIPVAACVAERAGRPIAGVPWHLHDDPLLGKRRISLAFSDYCDVLAVEEAASAAVIQYVLSERETPWTLLTPTLPQMEVGADHGSSYLWQSINLRPDISLLWAAAHKAVRNAVRNAERQNVTIHLAQNKDDLRSWFQVHLWARKSRHRLLPQPYAFFEHLWDEFIVPGNGFLLLACQGDEIIGGDVFLLWDSVCYYKFNASTSKGYACRANNLLLWRGIEEAKGRGCASMDLGRTPVGNSGLVAFKAHFGASSRPLYSLTFNAKPNPERDEREEALHNLLGSMTQLLTTESVPDSVTEQGGALLYWRFA